MGYKNINGTCCVIRSTIVRKSRESSILIPFLYPISPRTIIFVSTFSFESLLDVCSLSLPAFVAKIKCSICSSQCDSWDRRYMRRLLSPWFLELEMQLGACSAHLTGWLAIAVPARSAHSPQGGRKIIVITISWTSLAPSSYWEFTNLFESEVLDSRQNSLILDLGLKISNFSFSARNSKIKFQNEWRREKSATKTVKYPSVRSTGNRWQRWRYRYKKVTVTARGLPQCNRKYLSSEEDPWLWLHDTLFSIITF